MIYRGIWQDVGVSWRALSLQIEMVQGSDLILETTVLIDVFVVFLDLQATASATLN